jgi:diguanylate cyclase
MNKSSLRRQLVLPYVLLVISVSIAIGWVSYQASEEAVRTLSHRILAGMLDNVREATEQHFAGALTALNSIDPDPQTVPRAQPFPDSLQALESRLWVAGGLFMDINNCVYFGGEDGRFVGISRVSKDLVQFYLREPTDAQRHVYQVSVPGDRSRLVRSDAYDPRTRPWYAVALAHDKPVWSRVYNNFHTKEPTITLAKAVRRPDRSLAGVLATDLTLKALSEFLRTLKTSSNGIAFVMDADGYMIATSGKEALYRMKDGAAERLRVEDMQTPLIRQAYANVRNWKGTQADAVIAREFDTASGPMEIAAGALGGKYGVDWIAVVVVPRADFMGGVSHTFVQGVFVAIVCIAIALFLGLTLLNRVLRDLRQLTDAAKRMGDGEPLPSLNIRRRDELGQLAMTFSEMEHNLRIDKLTAVFNRASLIAQIGSLRRQLAQKHAERPSFALLFIDLDHFKSINDHHGHGAGDKVLIAVATRLKESVRITDVVARYGGDEFVVLLKGVTDADDVIATEDKIRRIVEEPVQLEHGTACVGVSIGWAMFPEDGEDVDALLKIADQRMFDTKKSRKAAR